MARTGLGRATKAAGHLPMSIFALLLLFGPLLSTDHQDIVHKFDFNDLSLQAGKFGSDRDIFLMFDPVDLRRHLDL